MNGLMDRLMTVRQFSPLILLAALLLLLAAGVVFLSLRARTASRTSQLYDAVASLIGAEQWWGGVALWSLPMRQRARVVREVMGAETPAEIADCLLNLPRIDAVQVSERSPMPQTQVAAWLRSRAEQLCGLSDNSSLDKGRLAIVFAGQSAPPSQLSPRTLAMYLRTCQGIGIVQLGGEGGAPRSQALLRSLPPLLAGAVAMAVVLCTLAMTTSPRVRPQTLPPLPSANTKPVRPGALQALPAPPQEDRERPVVLSDPEPPPKPAHRATLSASRPPTKSPTAAVDKPGKKPKPQESAGPPRPTPAARPDNNNAPAASGPLYRPSSDQAGSGSGAPAPNPVSPP